MFALAYASKANQNFSEPALSELAEKASVRNRELEVTGYLNYRAGTFFQYLEGEQKPVLELMAAIERDPRHRVVNLVHLGEVGDRKFSEWSMRYLNLPDLREIKLEDVLENVLLTMTTKSFDEPTIKTMALRLVEKIAASRQRLSRRAG
jgi:hypothetical protein